MLLLLLMVVVVLVLLLLLCVFSFFAPLFKQTAKNELRPNVWIMAWALSTSSAHRAHKHSKTNTIEPSVHCVTSLSKTNYTTLDMCVCARASVQMCVAFIHTHAHIPKQHRRNKWGKDTLWSGLSIYIQYYSYTTTTTTTTTATTENNTSLFQCVFTQYSIFQKRCVCFRLLAVLLWLHLLCSVCDVVLFFSFVLLLNIYRLDFASHT